MSILNWVFMVWFCFSVLPMTALLYAGSDDTVPIEGRWFVLNIICGVGLLIWSFSS